MMSGADWKAALSSTESSLIYSSIAFCKISSFLADAGGVAGEGNWKLRFVVVDIPSQHVSCRISLVYLDTYYLVVTLRFCVNFKQVLYISCFRWRIMWFMVTNI